MVCTFENKELTNEFSLTWIRLQIAIASACVALGVIVSFNLATFCAAKSSSLESLVLFFDPLGRETCVSTAIGTTDEVDVMGWKRGEMRAPATGALMSCGLGAVSYTVTNLNVIFFFGDDTAVWGTEEGVEG